MGLNDRLSTGKRDPQQLDAESEAAGGPVTPLTRRADSPEIVSQLDHLVEQMGARPGSFEARVVREMLQTALKLIPDDRDRGELKLMSTALKELRYAYRVFAKFREPHKVTIFGSARTPEDHPDFKAAIEFSRLMRDAGWMSITGAGLGIMRAGHIGPGREASFGVAIRLPFETNANEVIAGDEKLIHFRYFFTRKLMFISQAEAVALFPGGFGTLDEAFEAMTLVQTGKASPMPIVMLEGAGGDYWRGWDRFIREQLISRGLVSPEDPSIYHICATPSEAADHIIRYYRNYHSSRYVKDDFVIRIRRRLKDEDVARLGAEFALLCKEGTIRQTGALEGEDELPDLPRLVFHHTKSKFGVLRRLIDRINDCDPA